MSLLKMPLNTKKSNRGKLLLTKDHQIPVGLDVDCLERNIFWTDVFHQAIHSAPFNGSFTKDYRVGQMGSPEGIAVDWISRNIYWTDSVLDAIQVSRLDGSMMRTLITDGLREPRGIAVHPGLGKIYWTDWNRASPRIEVANMDGTSRLILVRENLGLPNMLVIDYFQNELYWTDAGLKEIQCIDLNGRNRRTILRSLVYPFDLAIVGEDLYWTDWST